MEKRQSKQLHHEWFWIDETRTEPFEGLPCFSKKELSVLKDKKLPDRALQIIFDTKKIGLATVESILINNLAVSAALKEEDEAKPNSPHDLGYKARQELKTVKGELAAGYASRIRQTIEEAKLRGIKQQVEIDLPCLDKNTETGKDIPSGG